MSDVEKKLLLICRRAPDGNPLARAALDVALAAAAFDRPLSVLFMDDGVWQLLPGQSASSIDAKSVRATLDSLPLYDIEQFHVCGESLEDRGIELNTLPGELVALDSATLGPFIESHDQVLSF